MTLGRSLSLSGLHSPFSGLQLPLCLGRGSPSKGPVTDITQVESLSPDSSHAVGRKYQKLKEGAKTEKGAFLDLAA